MEGLPESGLLEPIVKPSNPAQISANPALLGFAFFIGSFL